MWSTRKKNEETVGFSGDFSRADITKKKKQQFLFIDKPSNWESLIKEDNQARFVAFTHTSSFVGNVKYDSDELKMEIILGGKTYTFCNVPQRIYDGFEGADSKGAYFNRIIKTQFDC